MEEREFSEVEPRTMLADASRVVSARHPDRFLAMTRHRGNPWVVVLEPDLDDQLLFVVTAFSQE
jgi:hypothetical protein